MAEIVDQTAQTSHFAVDRDVCEKRRSWLPLAVLVFLTIAVRLPGVSRPLVGQFATKNAVYAMIARNWASGRSPFWLPMIDCQAGGQRGLHLLEVPVAAYLAGAGWAVFGGSLDVWGRATSIAFSAGGVALLFLLVRRWHGDRAAAATALVLALSPVSVIFGQSFMLESSAIFFILLALAGVERWLVTAGWHYWLLATLSLSLMAMTKVFLLVMLLPLASLVVRKLASVDGKRRRRWLAGALAMALLGAAPAAVWCGVVASISARDNPLSTQVYYSFCRSTSVHSFPSPLLVAPEFYLRLTKGLVGAGLTPIGFGLAAVGLFHKKARRHSAWLLASAILVVLLPGKFFELRYYLLLLVPALAVLAGLGWEAVSTRLPAPRLCGVLSLATGLCCSLWFVAGPAWLTPREDCSVTTAAAAFRRLPDDGAPVATLHGAAPDLLYYCDRPGWALSVNDSHLDATLERCRRQGARWLVVADLASFDRNPAEPVIRRLPLVKAGQDYRVYRLSAE
ncbi:MAG TPA: glycosyltransferase family 39 protein [Pirellulales bacterium]|nr:glycosyltransferase family 39 protein [Pirellulales bacterium]